MFEKFRNWFNNHRNDIAITLFIISIIILIISLVTKIENPIITIIGCTMTSVGIVLTLYDKDSRKRGFEIVKDNKRKADYVALPTRATKNSAAYDFYCNDDYIVQPNEIIKIWTDIKAYMQDDEFLMLDVRSSMGGKFMLANTIGIIDSDYYSNPDNDGNIGIFLKNISNIPQEISKGDKIAQGIFEKYLKVDNDNTTIKRSGGFGSSGK